VLTYGFKLSEAAEITPRFPVLSTLLYESPYEAQYWYNTHNCVVHVLSFARC
jgi:hypothetical protein